MVTTEQAGLTQVLHDPHRNTPKFGRSSAAGLVLDNRETERTGVAPGRPLTDRVRTHGDTEALQRPPGLIRSLPARRDGDQDREVHRHGPRAGSATPSSRPALLPALPTVATATGIRYRAPPP